MPRHDDPQIRFLPLSKIMEQMADDDASQPQPLLAQVSDLETVFARFVGVHTFSAGDLVSERQGMGMIAVDPAPVLIILRFLDLADAYDRDLTVMFSHRSVMARPDCMVAFKDADGDLRICPHETWRLEPYDGERL